MDKKVTGFTVAEGVTRIGRIHFSQCSNLASLEGMREGVRVIHDCAFYSCLRLTSLRGLPKYSLTKIGYGAFADSGLESLGGLPSTVTTIEQYCFASCFRLASIGPGFSPNCDVHLLAFDDCAALLAAAEVKGFSSIVAWGKHHWLVVNRRFAALAAVCQVRRGYHGEPSQLLARIALLCDDLVREVVEFVGASG